MSELKEDYWYDSSSDWSTTESSYDIHSIINMKFLQFISVNIKHSRRATIHRVKVSISKVLPKLGLRQRLKEALQIDNKTSEVSSFLLDRIVMEIRQQIDYVHVGALIVHHLSDPENGALREAVLNGSLTPERLAAMQENELVNPRLKEKWEKQRINTLQQKTVAFIEELTSTVTTIYACPSCGGEKCFLRQRQADKQKWAGDDTTPFLLTCCACSHAFRR